MEKNNQKKRKIPMRLCLGCNTAKPKKELVRIVKNKDGDIAVDFTGKMAGRGAYICNDKECLAKLEKNKRLQKAFGGAIAPEIFAQLQKELSDGTK